MPGGRPTKYKKAHCQALIDHMAKGYSATAFAASIDTCRDTITAWAKTHPEFSLALKTGKAKCAAWWEETAHLNAREGKGSSIMTVFGLKNMAPDDWQEKQITELTGKDGAPLPVTVFRARKPVSPPDASDDNGG